MRILVKSGSTEQVLCHGHVTGVDKHVGPTGLRVSGPVAAQVAQFLRATQVTVWNRANREVRVAFGITRECASAIAAEKFCFSHPRDCLRSTTVIIQAEGQAGAFDKLTLANAVVTQVACEQFGVAVVVNYEIVGGSIT